jgi:hypothetical protein
MTLASFAMSRISATSSRLTADLTVARVSPKPTYSLSFSAALRSSAPYKPLFRRPLPFPHATVPL